jgi:hypothetical protein
LVDQPMIDERSGTCSESIINPSSLDHSSLSEAFEPAGSPTAADVPPEESEDWGDPQEEADPTETPVDEADFDDAGLSETADLQTFEPSDEDLDRADPAVSSGLPSTGPLCWPWGLKPRAWTRGVNPSRTPDRSTPRRHQARSSEALRRPSSSRRPGRREPGRPRRITRAFPPRSPPERLRSVVRTVDNRVRPSLGEFARARSHPALFCHAFAERRND